MSYIYPYSVKNRYPYIGKNISYIYQEEINNEYLKRKKILEDINNFSYNLNDVINDLNSSNLNLNSSNFLFNAGINDSNLYSLQLNALLTVKQIYEKFNYITNIFCSIKSFNGTKNLSTCVLNVLPYGFVVENECSIHRLSKKEGERLAEKLSKFDCSISKAKWEEAIFHGAEFSISLKTALKLNEFFSTLNNNRYHFVVCFSFYSKNIKDYLNHDSGYFLHCKESADIKKRLRDKKDEYTDKEESNLETCNQAISAGITWSWLFFGIPVLIGGIIGRIIITNKVKKRIKNDCVEWNDKAIHTINKINKERDMAFEITHKNSPALISLDSALNTAIMNNLNKLQDNYNIVLERIISRLAMLPPHIRMTRDTLSLNGDLSCSNEYVFLCQIIEQMQNGIATDYKTAAFQTQQIIETQKANAQKLAIEKERMAREERHRRNLERAQLRAEQYAKEQAEAAQRAEEYNRQQAEYSKQQAKAAEKAAEAAEKTARETEAIHNNQKYGTNW